MPRTDMNIFDPPLTPKGMLQAVQTGQHLSDFFTERGYKFKKIIIQSSPFMRCLMTSNGIAMGLVDKGKTTIEVKVDSYLCHYM